MFTDLALALGRSSTRGAKTNNDKQRGGMGSVNLDVPRDHFPCRTAAAGRFEVTFHFQVTNTADRSDRTTPSLSMAFDYPKGGGVIDRQFSQLLGLAFDYPGWGGGQNNPFSPKAHFSEYLVIL